MRQYWDRAAERLDAATLRERIMVFAALVVAMWAVMDFVLIEPQVTRARALGRELTQRLSEGAAFAAQMQTLLKARVADPDAPLRERLVRLRGEIAELDQRIAQEERRFTDPAEMRPVLAEILDRNRNVKLVDLNTLAPTAIAGADRAAKPAPAGAPERRVFRHGIELTVSGAYLDLLAYVQELERLSTQLYWGGAELNATAYPVVTLKLVIYTLSLDPAWLNV